MPQAILSSVEKTKSGIKLTFIGLDGKELSGIYNGVNLDEVKLTKLIGNQIAYNEREGITISKAWDSNQKPTYCDDPMHGIDR